MEQQEVYQALADPTRRRILVLLGQGPLSAGEIAQQFEMSWPSVSRHLGVLRSANLVSSTRTGQSVRYELETGIIQVVAKEIGEIAGRESSEQGVVLVERLNEHARQVMTHALEEARDLGHAEAGLAHLVLGLLHVRDGDAARTLESFYVFQQPFREQVHPLVGRRADDAPPASFAAAARRAIVASLDEAVRLGHTYVGSGPMLLAVLDEIEGPSSGDVAALVLGSAFGLEVSRARRDVLERMRGYATSAEKTRGGGGMFERFTDRARRVIVLAQEEARLMNHNYIGTEHLMLGLIHEENGLAGEVLRGLGVTLEGFRGHVSAMIGVGTKSPQGHIPFTPRSKTTLENALREALELGHSYIASEHLLLGLIREGEGVALKILGEGLGHSPAALRQAVLDRISAEPHEERLEASAEQRMMARVQTTLEDVLRRLEQIEKRLPPESPGSERSA